VKLSIIIPVYNEMRTISEVVDRVRSVDIGAIEKEIIIANDGSSDGTRDAIDASHWSSDPRIRTYDNPINVGKGAAVRIGLKYATGDIILIQDADLELDPEEYGGLLEPLLAGRSDVVYGSRFLKPTTRISFRARVGNRLLTWLTNLLFRAHLTDMETAYKVFRRESLDGIRLRCVGFDFEPSSRRSSCAPAGVSSRCRCAITPGASMKGRRSAGRTASTPSTPSSNAALPARERYW
jgi:glycosyltransferase involved in cell wall biosynthesis